MATTNANIARGLIPYRMMDGSLWNGAANMYSLPASLNQALFVGDPIVFASGAGNDANGIPTVTIATAAGTNKILGSFVGIVNGGNPQITVTRDLAISHLASTAQYILVADDPRLLFMIQDDASAQATASSQWANKNASLVAGAGSTITGYSGWQMASSTVASGSNLQVKIIRPLDQADNAVSTVANTNQNAKWLVKLNIHSLADSTNGV